MNRTEYMREYRKRNGGQTKADRAATKAQTKAANWIRWNHPELWRQFLDEAYDELKTRAEK